MSATDFHIRRLAHGDTALRPASDRAVTYVRAYRDLYGKDALVGMSLYVETSRDHGRLTALLRELRADGFTFRR